MMCFGKMRPILETLKLEIDLVLKLQQNCIWARPVWPILQQGEAGPDGATAAASSGLVILDSFYGLVFPDACCTGLNSADL